MRANKVDGARGGQIQGLCCRCLRHATCASRHVRQSNQTLERCSETSLHLDAINCQRKVSRGTQWQTDRLAQQCPSAFLQCPARPDAPAVHTQSTSQVRHRSSTDEGKQQRTKGMRQDSMLNAPRRAPTAAGRRRLQCAACGPGRLAATSPPPPDPSSPASPVHWERINVCAFACQIPALPLCSLCSPSAAVAHANESLCFPAGFYMVGLTASLKAS